MLAAASGAAGASQQQQQQQQQQAAPAAAATLVVARPSCWNKRDRSALVQVSNDGLVASYMGPGRNDADAAAVRSNVAIASSDGIWYFEITVMNKGRAGYIGVGVCTASVPLNRLPGWERGSFGYHGDDGMVFRGGGTGTAFGPTFTTGDVVGCIVNFLDSTISYTKNGTLLGTPFTNFGTNNVHGNPLFAVVGMRSAGEVVQANFGAKPFAFPIDSYRREQVHRCVVGVRQTSLGDAETALPSVILSYLIASGYAESARRLAQSAGLDTGAALDDATLARRQRVRAAISGGDLHSAIALLQAHAGGAQGASLWDARADIRVRMLVQLFLERVRAHDLVGALEVARASLRPIDPQLLSPELRRLLHDAISLLAYAQPETSPLAHLLALEAREHLAELVNTAMLEHVSGMGKPLLDTLLRQYGAVEAALHENGSGAAAFARLGNVVPLASDGPASAATAPSSSAASTASSSTQLDAMAGRRFVGI